MRGQYLTLSTLSIVNEVDHPTIFALPTQQPQEFITSARSNHFTTLQFSQAMRVPDMTTKNPVAPDFKAILLVNNRSRTLNFDTGV